MKLKLTKRRKWIIGGALLLGTATPSFALFGLGDIVFDPTNYAQLVSQLTTLTKSTPLPPASTAPSKPTSRTSRSRHLANAAQQDEERARFRNAYGETNGMTMALNSGLDRRGLNRLEQFQSCALQRDTNTLLNTQPVGNSAKLSQLAIVETVGHCIARLLNAVGSYRAARTPPLPPKPTCKGYSSTGPTPPTARFSSSTSSTRHRPSSSTSSRLRACSTPASRSK